MAWIVIFMDCMYAVLKTVWLLFTLKNCLISHYPPVKIESVTAAEKKWDTLWEMHNCTADPSLKLSLGYGTKRAIKKDLMGSEKLTVQLDTGHGRTAAEL